MGLWCSWLNIPLLQSGDEKLTPVRIRVDLLKLEYSSARLELSPDTRSVVGSNPTTPTIRYYGRVES